MGGRGIGNLEAGARGDAKSGQPQGPAVLGTVLLHERPAEGGCVGQANRRNYLRLPHGVLVGPMWALLSRPPHYVTPRALAL